MTSYDPRLTQIRYISWMKPNVNEFFANAISESSTAQVDCTRFMNENEQTRIEKNQNDVNLGSFYVIQQLILKFIHKHLKITGIVWRHTFSSIVG